MKKSLFRVWFLDVWGNKRDGYQVNDRSEVGSIMLSMGAEKPEILQALYEKGILVNPETIDTTKIEILDSYPDLDVDVEGKPMFQIVLEEGE